MSIFSELFGDYTTSSTVNGNKRIAYLDMMKGIGMFIVVSGHIHSQYGWFSLPIHSFVIPLYFFLSGLTFRRGKFVSFGVFVKHRAKTLLLPYVIFSVLTWLIWALYNTIIHADVSYWFPLLQTIIAQGSGDFLVHNVPLWFIPCLFVIECLYYFIDKLPTYLNVLVCVACALFGVWMIAGSMSHVMTLLPWSMESAFAAIIFYCAGNVLTKKQSLQNIETKVLSKKWLAIVAIIIVTPILVLSSHWNGHVSLGSDLLGESPLFFYINAFIGITSVFLFSILLCSIPFKSTLAKVGMNFHLYIGRNSFYIMATHVPIKGFLIVMLGKLINESRQFVVNDYICCAIVFSLTCLICAVLSVYINKQKKKDHLRISKQ